MPELVYQPSVHALGLFTHSLVAHDTLRISAETAAMLFWALLASGQITMRKVDGWQMLAEKPAERTIGLAA